MNQIPDADKQQQERADNLAKTAALQGEQVVPGPQEPLPAPAAQVPDEYADLLAPGDDENEDEDAKKRAPGVSEREVALRQQKERLEDQGRWQANASFQQQEEIARRENERYIEFGRQRITLSKFSSHYLQEVEKLFVEPACYQLFEQRLKESSHEHIMVIAGQENSGKVMTAIYLAQRLWSDRALDFYWYADRNKTLVEIISDEKLPDNAVIIFEEVFDRRLLSLDELTRRFVDINEDLANLTNVWFIFTVLDGPSLEALQARKFPILRTTGVNCQHVMEKLIDFSLPEPLIPGSDRASLLIARESLNPQLTPSDLRQLFDTYNNDINILIKYLKKERDFSRSTAHEWFNSLKPMNYKLYALLVVLFDKLDMPTLEEIYTNAVNELRRQGMDGPDEFIDPRRIGTDTMHARLGIQVRSNVLEFRHRMYRQYTEAQIENFQRLLWSLIDPDDPTASSGLLGLIQRLSAYDLDLARRSSRDARYTASSDQLRQLRYAVAVMIARVGVYHLPKLDLLLGKLVRDESALVSLTAAFVLAEIARRGDHFDFIEKLLNAWYQSGSFDQMWAAVASIAYIYEAIARVLEDERASLSEDEEDDEELDDERKGVALQDQKKRWKAYLAKLRDILTELVKIHDHFSDETVNEQRSNLYILYNTRLRQQLEDDAEYVTGYSRPFRDLSEVEQEKHFRSVYSERKKTIDEAVRHDISMLINSWCNQMRMVLMQTLGYIAQMWPRDISRLVRVWLDRKDTENPLWKIGHMALNYLFRESIPIKDASLLERSAYPLLDLIPLAMRVHTSTLESFVHDINLLLQIEDLADTGTLGPHIEVGNLLRGDGLIYALYAIQRWYENPSHLPAWRGNDADDRKDDEDEEDEAQTSVVRSAVQKRWQQAVYSVLSNSMNSAIQEERQRLRNALFLWIKSRDTLLTRIARTLITHSYVMDGIVLDLPTSQRVGVIVLDGNRREREDREQIFFLIQNLSAIVPLHLRWLGYTPRRRVLNSDNRDEKRNEQRADENTSCPDPDDLLLSGANRPALLMPIMVPRQGETYEADRCYFVAVFHTGPILDLADFYQNKPDSEAEPEGNKFARYLQGPKAASASLSQPWQGKVYLLPSSLSNAGVSPEHSLLLTVVRPESIGVLEEELRRRIATTLRSCPAPDLWRDLHAYMGNPADVLEAQTRTVASLASEIDHWFTQLADTSTLYPDVSLFILWTIMLRSRENLAEAIMLIERMWPEKVEGPEDKAAKRIRKLKLQMGIACTRMLFHLYGTDNPTLAAEHYGALLTQLPQVIANANSYTEILPVLTILFQLARATDWLQLLTESDGAFFECINKVAPRDILLLQDWLKYQRLLIDLSRLFIDSRMSFSDFCDFSNDVYRQYRESSQKRPAREPLPPGSMADKFLALLPAENDHEGRARYSQVMQQIEFQQSRLRNPNHVLVVLDGLKNQEVLLNYLMNELQIRLDGKIEPLKPGECYGIVMVEAHNKTAVHQAFLFVQQFVEQRRLSKGQHVTLTLHRLGEKEILARVRNSRKIRNEREIIDSRKLPALLGPLLERYPAEQVGFVLMITASPIIDYDDWAEQDQWTARLWVAGLGRWRPYRGELVSLGASTPLTLETLLKRVAPKEE